jgi:hypothetical protein
MSLPDDQPVRHQSFQNQVKSWISNSLFDKFTYTIRRGPIKGMKRKGGLAWIPDWLVKDQPQAKSRQRPRILQRAAIFMR